MTDKIQRQSADTFQCRFAILNVIEVLYLLSYMKRVDSPLCVHTTHLMQKMREIICIKIYVPMSCNGLDCRVFTKPEC
jgi:hypothetical protein